MYNITHETIINICTELDWLKCFIVKQECIICNEIDILYSFTCKHTICYSCYTKLLKKDICYYCRQPIFNESDVDDIEYFTNWYYIILVIDFLIVLFIAIFKTVPNIFRIASYIQYSYILLLTLLYSFKRIAYITRSNILYTGFNIAFVTIIMILTNYNIDALYPFYFGKLCFLIGSITYEYYRYKIRKCFTT